MGLAELAARAEEVAAAVDLSKSPSFQKARRLVRDALATDEVASEIERLVGEMLAPVAVEVPGPA